MARATGTIRSTASCAGVTGSVLTGWLPWATTTAPVTPTVHRPARPGISRLIRDRPAGMAAAYRGGTLPVSIGLTCVRTRRAALA